MSSVRIVAVEDAFVAVLQKDKKVYTLFPLTFHTIGEPCIPFPGEYTIVFGTTREKLLAGLYGGYPDYSEGPMKGPKDWLPGDRQSVER